MDFGCYIWDALAAVLRVPPLCSFAPAKRPLTLSCSAIILRVAAGIIVTLGAHHTRLSASCPGGLLPGTASTAQASLPPAPNDGIFPTISVSGGGTGPRSFAWSFNGVVLTNANSDTLVFTGVLGSNAGVVTVSISNNDGSVVRNAAIWTGLSSLPDEPPTIATQPASLTVTSGSAASFKVVATGTPAPTYQWKKNGVPIARATASTYTIASTRSSDTATYTVIVSNVAGSITSSPAKLTIKWSRSSSQLTDTAGSSEALAELEVVSASMVDGRFHMSLTGPVDINYVIWGSADGTVWQQIITLPVAKVPFEYIDADPATNSARFYKATVPI